MKLAELFPDSIESPPPPQQPVETGRELELAAQSLAERATAYQIVSAEDAERALVWLRDEIVPRRKAVEAWFAPFKQRAHDAHRALCEEEKRILALIPEALIRQKVGAYQAAQRRQREQAEREAAAEARRLAEIAQAAAFDAAVAAGDDRTAEAILEAPAPPIAVAPVTVAAPVAVAGISQRTTWAAEVTDFAALVRWVAESPAERQQYVAPVMPALNGVAKRLKSALAIPGVRAVESVQLGVRS